MEGRASLLEISLEGAKYCIANIYAPNNDDTSFLESVFQDIFGRTRDDYIILAGDWNTVLDNNLDKIGGNPTHGNRKCQTLLNNIISDWGLHEVPSSKF